MATEIESNQDLEIYRDKNHTRIFAGPGAGKTHLLIENIRFIVENSKHIKQGIKKILCMTYTNAAADEIMNRLGSYNKYVVTSTIHSFINEYIIKQFQLQLKIAIEKDFDIEVPKNLSIVSQREGLTPLSGMSKEEIFIFIDREYSSISSDDYSSLSKKKMTDVVIDINPVNQVNSLGNEIVALKVGSMSEILAKAIKDFTWSVAGKLSFDEILYFGWKLITNNDLILHILRVEFPYIMIDEYQDTNPIQNLIVRKISEKGVIVTIVGDIAQSIYSFQGASYLDFMNFSLPSSLPIKNFVIDGNRRSTENIIKLLNYLRKEDNNLSKQFCAKNKENNPCITFVIQEDKKIIARPIREIIGNDTKILCRKWSEAFMYVDDITDGQKALLSKISGVYTYQLNRDLFTEVEAKQENWIDIASTFSALETAFKTKSLPMFLEIIKRYVNTNNLFSNFDSAKVNQLNNLVEFWNKAFSDIDDTDLLKDIVLTVNTKLNNAGIEIKEEFKYPNDKDDEYFEPIYKYIDKITYGTAKKIVDEIFIDNSNYMTIHRSKGKEFDSVFVNGDPFASEKKIAQVLWVLTNPSIISDAPSEETFIKEEYTRLLYVGCSRAINKLYIHLYGNKDTAKEIDETLIPVFGENNNLYNFKYC